MKKNLIAFVLATATTLGSVSLGTTTVKAESFNKIYQSAYDCTVKLQNLGKEYHITPRLKSNGSKMEDNKLNDVVASSGEIQKTIDALRVYQHQFPDAYWKARNTFSEIGDGYQQPIYEWIVDIAVNLQKSLKEVNNMSKEKLQAFINDAEIKLDSANILNKGVDPAYKGAYQAALDDIRVKLNKIKDDLIVVKNGWVQKDSKWYFYENGEKKTGWSLVNHKCYFFNKDGSMKTGWYSVTSNGKTYWYYLEPSGERAGGWEKVNNAWYFFDTEVGEMRTGWVGIEYNTNGTLKSVTYDKPSGQAKYTYYYMNESGAMVTGKKTINGVSCVFDGTGALIGKN